MKNKNVSVSKRSKQIVSKTIPKGSWVQILPDMHELLDTFVKSTLQKCSTTQKL